MSAIGTNCVRFCASDRRDTHDSETAEKTDSPVVCGSPEKPLFSLSLAEKQPENSPEHIFSCYTFRLLVCLLCLLAKAFIAAKMIVKKNIIYPANKRRLIISRDHLHKDPKNPSSRPSYVADYTFSVFSIPNVCN
jgi:hypothetical protein